MSRTDDMDKTIDTKIDIYHNSFTEVVSTPANELPAEKNGTERDEHDMARMGKAQLLRVRSYL